jgi:hypothetical protein
MMLYRHPRARSVLARVLLLAMLLASALPAVPATANAQTDVDEEIRLTIATPDFSLDGTGLRVPGYATHSTPGAPALPVRIELVPLPADRDWTISYTASEGEVLTLDAALPAVRVPELNLHLPGGLPINDPDAAADLPSAVPLVERPDPAIYGADAFYPARLVEAGPVVQQRGQRFLPVRVFPFQYNPVQGQLMLHRTIEVRIALSTAADTVASADSPATGSLTPAANPPGLRLRTTERGLYQLTYGDLQAAGVPLGSANPAQFAVSYLGAPVDIEVTGAADGRFDPGDLVIFYAEPYTGRYMNHNVYRFTWSGAPAARMAARSVSAPAARLPLSVIPQTIHFERDRSYYSTYDLPRDADHLFDDPLYANAAVPVAGTTYTLTLRNLAAAGTARLQASFHGGAALIESPDQSVALRINSYDLGVHQWDGSVTHLVEAAVPVAALAEGANPLRLETALDQLPGITGYWVSPDWVKLTYPALARAESNRLYVEGQWTGATDPGPRRIYLPLLFSGAAGTPAPQPQPFSAGGFTSAGIRVYDVRDARHPVRLDGAAQTPAGGTYEVQFLDGAGAGAAYFLAVPEALRQPSAIEPDAGSAWRSPAVQADYIAIVHRSLWDAVQPLLDHREATGLRVAKVDVQHVYDEFSGGRVDPEALRAFLTYAYHNWNPGGARPAYVLLVGDGHYDFKAALRPDMPNLIPPYLLHVDPFIGETAADNRYASVDGDADFMPDMALGRIPARTPAEVTALVDKILAYENPAVMPGGPWQNRVTFVADQADDPAGDFHALSDNIRLNTLPAAVESRTIYWEKDYIYAYPQNGTPDMNTAIKSALGDSVMVQWFGHASRFRWGSTQVFSNFSIIPMPKTASLPMTVDYSCWTGYFINLFDFSGDSRSLSEAFVLTPDKGSVVSVGPSGLHIGSALLELNRGLVKAVFTDKIQPVGVALDAARQHYLANSDAWLDIVDTTVLFGDPATRLRLP